MLIRHNIGLFAYIPELYALSRSLTDIPYSSPSFLFLSPTKMTVVKAYCPGMDDAVKIHGGSQVTYENGSHVDIEKFSCLLDLFDVGCVCNNAHLNGKKVIGQPTEGALLIAAKELGIPDRRNELRRVQEVGVHFREHFHLSPAFFHRRSQR